MKQLRYDMKRKRKQSKEKFDAKLAHLKKEKERKLIEKYEIVPEELKQYAECKIFSKRKYEEIQVKYNEDSIIGDISLDTDERSILRLNPKFAVMQRLDSEQMEREIEIGFTKMRYEIKRRERRKLEEEVEYEGLNGKKRKVDTGEDNEKALLEDAKERQIYDPIDKIFDHSKKRVTDLQECAEVYLPKPVDEKYECEMEIIRNVILEEFNSYKEKIERNIERNNKKTGRNQAPEMNQEGINLSMNERKGLKKLQKRIQKGEIAIIKTDKSGKTTAISKEDYLKMGREANSSDKKVDRKERKNINPITLSFNENKNSFNILQRISIEIVLRI